VENQDLLVKLDLSDKLDSLDNKDKEVISFTTKHLYKNDLNNL